MADDATNDVKDAEITLDDFNADEQAPAKAESSPAKEEAKAETKPEVVKETTKEKTDDTAAPPDVPTKAETEEPEEADETPAEDKPQGKAEERKAQLNSEIRDLVAQRNALKTEVEKANAEVYQPATEDELVDSGMTQLEAKVEAMRQQQEMEKFNTQVAEAQLTIASESDRVLRDFPIFNPDSEQYDKELAQEAAGHLESMLVIDPNTQQVIGSNGSIYQYYNTLARASGISVAKGQIQGQKDTQQMLANTDAGSSVAPPKEVKDPLMELWKSDD